jgi:hypothetical protein
MKRLSRIQNLFEQDAEVVDAAAGTPKAEDSGSKIKLIKSVSLPNPQIQVQWDYTYSWPEKNPLLGSVAEFVKTLKTSAKGDAKAILDIITKAEPNSAIGITRAAGNTQNTRLFGKNLSQTTGSIFLFKPNLITASKIPADKNVGDINGNPVFSIEGQVMAAIKPYMDSTVADANSGRGLKTISQKTTKVFTQVDGDGYNWYASFSTNYMIPILNAIDTQETPITASGKITPIFWGFMVYAPLGFAVGYDQSSGKNVYSVKLRDAIQRLLGEAGKIDPAYTSVDASILTKFLFEHIVKATLVLCLNKGALVKSNLENNFVPEVIQKPMVEAKSAATAMGAAPAASSNNAAATTGFDGTAVNNETDLAKIISGKFIDPSIGIPATDVDTVDKVKAKWNSYVPANYSKKFEEIVKKLPFNSKTSANLVEFQNIQYLVTKQYALPYGPDTIAAFKAAFEKSPIK